MTKGLTKKEITKIARDRVGLMLMNAMEVEYENNVGIEGDVLLTGDPDYTREQNEAIYQRVSAIVDKFTESNWRGMEKLEATK